MSKRKDHISLQNILNHASEAANRVSPSTQRQHPDIQWPQIIGMRNRLIHGYDVIDIDLLWDTIIDDLPPLIKALKKILNQ